MGDIMTPARRRSGFIRRVVILHGGIWYFSSAREMMRRFPALQQWLIEIANISL
ncbi:MAG: hypothetical protein M0P95_05985 [Sulfuritalea sp.]|jgi:hypothetical protein|nr:hypothetical protein [Sulfuritalea sp.]